MCHYCVTGTVSHRVYSCLDFFAKQPLKFQHFAQSMQKLFVSDHHSVNDDGLEAGIHHSWFLHHRNYERDIKHLLVLK